MFDFDISCNIGMEMNYKQYAFIGWASGILFWAAYFVMSSIRSDYYHRYKAVSELGSVGAPYAILWNITGFIFVGILISFFSVGLQKSISSSSGKGRAAFYFLFSAGLCWVFAGVFPGNFEDKASLTMILHGVGSLGSGLLFIFAVFSYVPAMRSSLYWRSSVMPSISIAVIFILSGFLRSGAAPALGQKIGFLIFFIWVTYMACKLYKSSANKAIHLGSGC